MERCGECGREVDSRWNYCIYCGSPMRTLPAVPPDIPAAIRPEPERPARRYDTPFWLGVGMGVLGLVLIIYAATQIYTTYG